MRRSHWRRAKYPPPDQPKDRVVFAEPAATTAAARVVVDRGSRRTPVRAAGGDDSDHDAEPSGCCEGELALLLLRSRRRYG